MTGWMMAFIGMDDTDHLEGGCTTWEFNTLLNFLTGEGHEVVSPVSLVRLWPFAPRRTRGNGALAAEVNPRDGDSELLISHLQRWFFNRFPIDVEAELAKLFVSPALIYSPNRFPEKWYWDAVRGEVSLKVRKNKLDAMPDIHQWTRGEGRGLIGATSAIAWLGKGDHTWEATAWRHEEQMGSLRMVPLGAVNNMCEKFENTMLNRDPNSSRTLIAPATPCPVLYGIRAESQSVAEAAHLWLQKQDSVEQARDYRVHKTNQATGDHLSGMSEGVVVSKPTEIKGGHASVSVFDGEKPHRIVGFKPGGAVNMYVKSLVPGDVVRWGGLLSPEGVVHLELLELVNPVVRNLSRPMCECGARLRRQGEGQPLRCDDCKQTNLSCWVGQTAKYAHTPVEPPPSQRRHLAKPLNRQGKV